MATYTVRSEGGTISWTSTTIRTDAMNAAQRLAVENEGQRIALLRDGRPVKGHVWCSGPRAEVQR